MATTTRPARWPAIVALALIGGWVLTVALYGFGNDWTRFLGIGRFYYERLPADLVAEPVYINDGMGFDGQFFYYQAHDPFLTHGAQSGFDLAMVRGRRLLFPLLAWLVSRSLGGDPSLTGVLIAINLMAVVALLGLLRRMNPQCNETDETAPSATTHPLAATWIPPLLLLTSFTLVPIYKTTSELLCMTLIVASALAHLRRLRILTCLFCALALLTKETAALWVLALMGEALWQRSPRDILTAVLSTIPLGLWMLALTMRLDVDGLTLDTIDPSLALNLEPPFKGLIDQGILIVHEGLNRRTTFSLLMMISLLSIAGYGLATLRRRLDAPVLFFLASLVLMLMLDQRCWDYMIDIGRQPFTLPLSAALLALGETSRNRVTGWIAVLAITSLWGLVFLLGKLASGLV